MTEYPPLEKAEDPMAWHGVTCPCGGCDEQYCGLCMGWKAEGHSHLEAGKRG